jgi:hypothetical protein
VLIREFPLSGHQSILEDYEVFEHVIRIITSDDVWETTYVDDDDEGWESEEGADEEEDDDDVTTGSDEDNKP